MLLASHARLANTNRTLAKPSVLTARRADSALARLPRHASTARLESIKEAPASRLALTALRASTHPQRPLGRASRASPGNTSLSRARRLARSVPRAVRTHWVAVPHRVPVRHAPSGNSTRTLDSVCASTAWLGDTKVPLERPLVPTAREAGIKRIQCNGAVPCVLRVASKTRMVVRHVLSARRASTNHPLARSRALTVPLGATKR